MEVQKTLISQNSLEKAEKCWKYQAPGFQAKIYSNQNIMVWAQENRHIDQINCIDSPEMISHFYGHYCGQESLRRNGVAIMVKKKKESKMQYLDAISKTTEGSLFIWKANHSVSW